MSGGFVLHIQIKIDRKVSPAYSSPLVSFWKFLFTINVSTLLHCFCWLICFFPCGFSLLYCCKESFLVFNLFFIFIFFQFYWDVIEIQHCISLSLSIQHNNLTYIHHEMITKWWTSLSHIDKSIKGVQKNFFLWWELLEFTLTILLQHIAVLIIFVIVYYIPITYFSYNWKFIPFDCFYTIPPPATLTSGSHKCDLFFNEFVCFWSIIGLWYYVSSCYTIKWCNISTCFKMITMVSLVTICHPKIIHSFWPYSAHCACHNCDSFIFVSHLEAGISQSSLPIPFSSLAPLNCLLSGNHQFILCTYDPVSVLLYFFICF